MFARPPVVQKDWSSMVLYEKLHHLIDHCTNFVVGKVNWWLPSVAVGMALSIFLLGGPDGVAQGVGVVLPVVTPIAQTPAFATPTPHQPQEAAEEESL